MSFNTGSINPPGPLAYEGTVAPSLIQRKFNPLPKFNTFEIGTIWVNTAASLAFILVSKALGVAVWLPIGGAAGAIETITTPDANVAVPVANNINFLQSGTISIVSSGNDITFSASGSGALTWTEITAPSSTLSANNGYTINTLAGCALLLPAVAAYGTIINIVGRAGGWTLSQQAGQRVIMGTAMSTLSIGSLASTYPTDCISLLCVTANSEFQVISSIGNITIT